MAVSAHKMVSLCAVLVIVVMATMGQATMADTYYADPDRCGLACPSSATTCGTICIPACNTFSQQLCDGVCRLTQPLEPLSGLGQICLSQVSTACIAICKNLCEPLPVQTKTSP
ncbi:hypothetical protein QYE76_029002 [Lolium multiflorum]|uniref:Thionin-like protein n=1 Tax=Lolium multiflorum TaxID=4521 RepID=A0AAD8VGA2_LOLMU|nr:hypothetical protein QYE76_029002 [Lolium multiflorum]